MHMRQYQHVFVKTSKSHTEQVIDANFNIMVNEMTNGDAYYVSDNGRIRKKTGYSRDHVRYTDQSQRSLNNGDYDYSLYTQNMKKILRVHYNRYIKYT